MLRRNFIRASFMAGLAAMLGSRVRAKAAPVGPETFDFAADYRRGMGVPQLIDCSTGEKLVTPPWYYADARARVIRCYRRDSEGRRYLATPDGRRVRNGYEWRRPDGTFTVRYEALDPDGVWRYWEGEAEVAWEEIRVARPFRIVLPDEVKV